MPLKTTIGIMLSPDLQDNPEPRPKVPRVDDFARQLRHSNQWLCIGLTDLVVLAYSCSGRWGLTTAVRDCAGPC
jgi:hypothetical protein